MPHGSCYILKRTAAGRPGHWGKPPSVVLAWERGTAVTARKEGSPPQILVPAHSCSKNLQQLRETSRPCHLRVIGGDALWPEEGLRETPSRRKAVKTSWAQILRDAFSWWRAGDSHTRRIKMTRQRAGGTGRRSLTRDLVPWSLPNPDNYEDAGEAPLPHQDVSRH